jgi:hypothetical protein
VPSPRADPSSAHAVPTAIASASPQRILRSLAGC